MASKVLLVEDDNNLREIYEARLMAEGYTIVTAKDGEEALTVAKAELPNLIISDVMMPRVSGFEMLDILRNTDTLKDVKVIMLTALGQADDKTRADSLGADRYLVKSQVTLEDIVKAAHELLEGAAPAPAPAAAAPTGAPAGPAPVTPSMPTPPVPPSATMPMAAPAVSPVPAPVAPPVAPAMPAATATPVAAPVSPAFNPSLGAAPTMPTSAPVASEPALAATPSIAADDAKPESTNDEMATVTTQIDNFVRQAPSSTPEAAATAAHDDAVLGDAVEDLAETAEEQPTEEPVDPEASAVPASDTATVDTNTGPAATVMPEPVAPPASEAAPISAPEPAAEPAMPTPPPAADPMPEPVKPAPEPEEDSHDDSAPVAGKKIIQPLTPAENKPGIHELLAREEANGTMPAAGPVAPATTFSPINMPPEPTQPPFGAPVVGDHSMPSPNTAPAPATPAIPTPPMPPTPAAPPTPPATPMPDAKPKDFDPNSISL